MLDIKVNKHLFRALAKFSNLAYSCFTFGGGDLVPTAEEYMALLHTKNKVDVFALSVYRLVVFPKALGHIDEAVTNLFDLLDKRVTPVPTILAETFRSLNERQRVGSITTLEYIEWWGRRINDNISGPSQGSGQPTRKHPQVVPSELEIIRQDSKRKNGELENKIEQKEEEKMNLRLDMDA
ncbi:hypothetical protein Gotri_026162 [Gossypium trilobum]|uniref:DUF7745 domain-containing protein n=1 Tax=Gossypium trilobum TaxID=34281 RepID=A0A7J9FJ14_9ROSI|nr:hypothetical protein [Gossypium trilobum]